MIRVPLEGQPLGFRSVNFGFMRCSIITINSQRADLPNCWVSARSCSMKRPELLFGLAARRTAALFRSYKLVRLNRRSKSNAARLGPTALPQLDHVFLQERIFVKHDSERHWQQYKCMNCADCIQSPAKNKWLKEQVAYLNRLFEQ